MPGMQDADPHAGHDMPGIPQADPHAGHDMSGAQQADPHAGHDMSGTQQADPHAGHVMSAMQADPHAGHDMPAMAMPDVQTSADNPGRPPEDPPPPAAEGAPVHAADLYFDPAVMAAARQQLRAENGAMRTGAIMIDQLEAAFTDDHDGYAWNAQAWYGGDINRVWIKTEGEGVIDEEIEDAELQLLYSRAVAPYWDVQTGVRQVYTPDADRTDLVVGVQGLAPYWFEVNAAAFLSTEGELRARAEAEYDLRLTQRLILQPSVEVNLSAEDIPEMEIGAGVTNIELGARLRYEFTRRFAPYVGVEWSAATGDTRDIIQTAGGDAEETRFLVGVRAWF
ncbi:MAG: copper resistance protein B [Hydrogenophilaceae bacterium]|nr:copper resistance protein B [Hydrogenophilaceae bacterium]